MSLCHPDNRAYVVSHVGLNVDRWWDDLKVFDEDDGRSFFEKMAKATLRFQNRSEDEISGRRYYQNEMEVLEETIEHLIEKRLLPKDTEALTDEVIYLLKEKGLDLESLGLSRQKIVQSLELRDQQQAQRACKQARRRLNERVRSAAKE